MSKINYLILTFFTLFSCIEEFQSPKNDRPLKPTASKSIDCKYWYKVASNSTTSTNTSHEYVYTTCVDHNTSTDSPSENDYYPDLVAVSGPTFPVHPAVDDTYDYTGPEGDYIKYNFTSDSTWRVMERIIPMLVVKTHPDIYAFLDVDSPVDGQVIFGLDDLYYTLKNDQWYGKKKQ